LIRFRNVVRAGPLLGALTALVAAGPSGAAYEVGSPGAVPEAAYVDDADCLDCHEDYSLAEAIHGDRDALRPGAAATTGCQSCHGPGSVHVETNEPGDLLSPATAPTEVANRLCLQCHRADEAHAFEASLHAMSDVTCSSCHSVHGEQRTGLLRAREPELCYGCHQDLRAAAYLPSHHPVREGKISCSDCHDPHQGGLLAAQPGDRSNDLCLDCHAGKQGPYIFEHTPVVEDCLICHTPHGSVANHLLVQNEPFLCLQCHQMHFHTTIPGIEGEFTSLDGYGGMSTRDGSKRGFLTKCTQCHTEVHGSDLPSQSISGGGGALTR
jgi:DmsE family decaheme c-type cytochrome